MATWKETSPEVLICDYNPKDTNQSKNSIPFQVAAFDLDSTLIKSKSGLWKTEDPEDWTWWHTSVPESLRKASDDGFQIVIITNQGRLTLSDGSASPAQSLFKAKIELILQALNLPVTLYAACANDNWRKPRTRAWEHYVQRLSQSGEVDERRSFLVGDAAGRVGDHDDADRYFSENTGIDFFTPEQWFLGAEKEPYIDNFNPKKYLLQNCSNKAASPTFVRNGPTVLYLLVGAPGAGKTTFYFNEMEPLGYERVDPKSLISVDHVEESIKKSISSGRAVVIDDLNLNRIQRQKWISLARDQGILVSAIYFTSPPKLCLHNDAIRALSEPKRNENNHKVYPRSAFWNLIDESDEPSVEEGFNEVHKVDFQWRGTEETLQVWQKFWA